MIEKPTRTTGSCLVVHPILPFEPGADISAAMALRSNEAMLAEAVGLAAAIDLHVVHADLYRVNRISPSHLLGTGARDEIAALIKQHAPAVVIINQALSPVQQRNLETDWEVKVIDRTGLILEIFGMRAQTAEGKIQVELAALQYGRSRLVRTWTHLERQRGGTRGIGGPGETQLEIDRRLIDDKIARLKRELETVKERRNLERKGREKVPFKAVAIVGYTNAGKSTLFNALTGSQVFAQDLLFATLDTTMRRLRLPKGEVVILSDTVGFISDLPTNLVAAFRATLEQLQFADVILHVRDLTAPDFGAQKEDVIAIMHDLGIEAANDPRVIEVWNKIDALDAEERTLADHRARDADGRVAIVSAQTGLGFDALLAQIEEIVGAARTHQTVRVPLADGAAMAWLHAHAHVESSAVEGDEMTLEIDIDPANWARFEGRFKKESA